MSIPKLPKCKVSSNDELFIGYVNRAELVGTIERNIFPHTNDDLPYTIVKAIPPKGVLHLLLGFDALNV